MLHVDDDWCEVLCYLQLSFHYHRKQSDSTTATALKGSNPGGSTDKKHQEFKDGPDLSDFISGTVASGETWEGYKGTNMVHKQV